MLESHGVATDRYTNRVFEAAACGPLRAAVVPVLAADFVPVEGIDTQQETAAAHVATPDGAALTRGTTSSPGKLSACGHVKTLQVTAQHDVDRTGDRAAVMAGGDTGVPDLDALHRR